MANQFRNFSLISYCREDDIKKVIQDHNNNIRAYAYILHDKDINEDGSPKVPHYHILLLLKSATTSSAICKWFTGITDIDGCPVNTFAENIYNVSIAFDYLSHKDYPNKAQYSEDSIIGFNLELFKSRDADKPDTVLLAFNDILDGVPLIEVAKTYGRDFIIHYGHIKLLLNDIKN